MVFQQLMKEEARLQGKKLLQEFEEMIDKDKVKSLSNLSLERPLSEQEFQEMKLLMSKLYGYQRDL